MASRNNGLLWFLLLHGLLWSFAWGKYHHHNFVLRETPYTRLCRTKSMLTINGQFPGPTIHAVRGDTVIVHVYNKANVNVTLHWHGVKQPRNPWSDGPVYITQCPIQAGGNFTYTIVLSNEEGTMWWHAHSDWTRATVHGAIIVYPAPGTTYPFPKPHREFPIILGSWWNRDVMDVLKLALTYGGDPNISDAHTINGQPGDLFPCSKQDTFRMAVEHGKTYLLRIIHAGMNSEMFLAVAQHQLEVVGRDGSYLKPFKTNFIMITPGQTMDVLLKADQPVGQYYMASRPYSSGQGVIFDNTTSTAIIQYHTSTNNSTNYASTLPRSSSYSPSFPTTLPHYNDTDAATKFVIGFRSLADENHPINVPLKINKRMEITISVRIRPCGSTNISCEGPNGSRLSASMNNISFQSPRIDLLEAYYYMINGVYRTDFPKKPPLKFNYTADVFPSLVLVPTVGTNVTVLDYNSTVEIVLQGTNVIAGENHPIHLHGYSFYVVGFGFGNFDKEKDPKNYNLVDPPLLNTIGVPKNGWAAIRFRARNPGVWFMHCHLERHLSWGMTTVFIVKNGASSNASILPPPPDMPPC